MRDGTNQRGVEECHSGSRGSRAQIGTTTIPMGVGGTNNPNGLSMASWPIFWPRQAGAARRTPHSSPSRATQIRAAPFFSGPADRPAAPRSTRDEPIMSRCSRRRNSCAVYRYTLVWAFFFTARRQPATSEGHGQSISSSFEGASREKAVAQPNEKNGPSRVHHHPATTLSDHC